MNTITLNEHDALILVDVQNDFLPSGALAVARGDEVIPVLNRYGALFRHSRLPVYASRDWHPANHCSFTSQGGPWPVHCVAGTVGAGFSTALSLDESTVILSKAENGFCRVSEPKTERFRLRHMSPYAGRIFPANI